MRISKLSISAFRGFQKKRTFDFDAECILLVGPNGRGKTSVFDAILWCLLGSISRIRGTRDAVGDRFIYRNAMCTAPPRVEMELTKDSGQSIFLTREEGSFEVKTESETLHGTTASEFLLGWIASSLDLTQDGFSSYFPRTHLLQQDTMMDFVRHDSPRERFKLLSSFLGLSQVSAHYLVLDQAAKEAEKEVAGRERRYNKVRDELTDLRAHISQERGWLGNELPPSMEAVLGELDSVLHSELSKMIAVAAAANDPHQIEQQTQRVMSEVQTKIVERERLRGTLKELLQLVPDVVGERSRQQKLEKDRAAVQRALELATEARQAGESVYFLAQKALDQTRKRLQSEDQIQKGFAQFLEQGKSFITKDECPYCGEEIKVATLMKRVERLLSEVSPLVKGLAASYSTEQKSLEEAREHVETLVAKERDMRSRLEEISRNLESNPQIKRAIMTLNTMGISSDNEENAVDLAVRDTLGGVLADLTSLQIALDHLSGIVAKARVLSASHRLEKLEARIRMALTEEGQLQHELDASKQLLTQLRDAVTAAKQAETELVETLMRGYEPVLKEYYYRIQPHPQFSDLRVHFKTFGDAGEVYFKVLSPKGEEINPSVTFSAGQASAMAVSLFLALNSRQNWTHLKTVLIDDPIQYLDDISMLGLVDLLRSWAEQKQLILSIHDRNLVPLLVRKFRGTKRGTRVRTYYFEGLSDEGPVISVPEDEILTQDTLSILKSRE